MDAGIGNKVVLVTGASGGIGSEIARVYAAEGARVAVHYHSNRAGAEAVAAEIGRERSLVVQADLTREDPVRAMWGEIERGLGPVEILIANSGICIDYGTPIHEKTLEDWNRTLAGNLTSMFLCAREFFQGVVRHRLEEPSMVMIGSTAGIHGEAFNADYAASKAAMNAGFLMSLKNELARLAPRGRVNTVCPGWTLTPMAEEVLEDHDTVRRVLQTMALRKVARPLDVAQAALYLGCARLSGHCSGQVITVAGGMEGRVLYSPGEIDPTKA